MSERSAKHRAGVISLGALALVAAFLVGRATAPDSAAVAGPDCSTGNRTGIAVPNEFANSEGDAFFSECEEQAARGSTFGEPASRVQIYSSPTGTEVVAWWYPDCGLPEGVFPVGTPHPAVCDSLAVTTVVASTP